jgi:hypothetical protein
MTKWFRDGTNRPPGQEASASSRPRGADAARGEDAAYADTEPMPLPEPRRAPGPALSGLSLAPVETSLYEVMAFIRKDNRVCPQPTRWLEFYRILQEAAAGAPLPAPPLTGSAWSATPASAKRTCFRDQVEWAASHHCLPSAWKFLKNLPDADWHQS